MRKITESKLRKGAIIFPAKDIDDLEGRFNSWELKVEWCEVKEHSGDIIDAVRAYAKKKTGKQWFDVYEGEKWLPGMMKVPAENRVCLASYLACLEEEIYD